MGAYTALHFRWTIIGIRPPSKQVVFQSCRFTVKQCAVRTTDKINNCCNARKNHSKQYWVNVAVEVLACDAPLPFKNCVQEKWGSLKMYMYVTASAVFLLNRFVAFKSLPANTLENRAGEIDTEKWRTMYWVAFVVSGEDIFRRKRGDRDHYYHSAIDRNICRLKVEHASLSVGYMIHTFLFYFLSLYCSRHHIHWLSDCRQSFV